MISSEEILIKQEITDENRLYIESMTRPENCRFAFYIYRLDEKKNKFEAYLQKTVF